MEDFVADSLTTASGRFARFYHSAYSAGVLALNNLGVYLFSILATILLPCLPLLIEWLRKSHIQPENVVLTAAVLAAAFAVTAEHSLTFVAHLAFFILSLTFDVADGPTSPISIDRWAGTLLIAVGCVHATERLIWHIVLSRPFPEGLQFGRKETQSRTQNA